MLSSKMLPRIKESNISENANEEFLKVFSSRLTVLSFDYTVCDNFDSLPLHQEYWSLIQKLSFKASKKDMADISFG